MLKWDPTCALVSDRCILVGRPRVTHLLLVYLTRTEMDGLSICFCKCRPMTVSGVRAGRGSGYRLRTAVLQCVTPRSSDSRLFLVHRL